MTSDTAWLTQEAFDRLKAELDELSGPGRAVIAKRIEAARAEGDLSENGGYHAAKEEQGKQEARIRYLQALLQGATVGEAPTDDGSVAPGMKVTVRMNGRDETTTFLLGARELKSVDSSLEAVPVWSPQSPLGAAVDGHRPGESVSYDAPNGRSMSVEIISAEPFTG